MRVYLLRHGETDWNVARRLQGSVDTPLNALGIRQAERWRPYFDGLRLAGIYSSSLQRTLHTASLATGKPACITPGFNERRFGEWEGQTWDHLKTSVKAFEEQWHDDSFIPQGGESRDALYRRVQAALQETVHGHINGDEILIVAHGASGHAILCSLLGCSIAERTTLPPLHNASLTVVERLSAVWRLTGQVPALTNND